MNSPTGYQQILQDVGWPTDVLVVDFESYYDSDYSVTKMSTIEYIMDDRFEFLGVGWADLPLFRPQFLPDVRKAGRVWQHKYGNNLEKCTVVAKNCKFDATIMVERMGIHPPHIVDIDDLLRHYDSRMSHKMKDVTGLFGLQAKGDSKQFKGLHWDELGTEGQQALIRYSYDDVDIEVKLFKKLLPELSNPTVELLLARHTLGLYLNPVLVFNFRKAKTLINSMERLLAKIVKPTGYNKKQIGSKKFAEYLTTFLPDGESVPMKSGKNKMIPAFAKDDVEFQKLLAHPIEEVRQLCKARQAVRSWPLHTKRIVNMVNQARVSGKRLRVPLHYYGGHTGRWSGGEKINLQNLGGRGRAGTTMHPLIAKVRNLIIAPPRHVLLIADSAQIEARILAWLAGQMDLLGGFAKGEDVYSTFAMELFNSYVAKPSANDPEPIRTLLKVRRGFGKDGILGAGFGMGKDKFYNRCLSNEDLRPLFDSGEYNQKFIERLINTYRNKYSKIPDYWGAVEWAFKRVIKYGYMEDHVFAGRTHTTRFFSKNSTVFIELPSGRKLRYRHCSIDKKRSIKWRYGHLWGGSITENIVQAVARDLLGYWILECEKSGIHICYHCHDSVMSVVPEKVAEVVLEEMLDTMRTKPDWAEGLPLDVEGEISKVFTV